MCNKLLLKRFLVPFNITYLKEDLTNTYKSLQLHIFYIYVCRTRFFPPPPFFHCSNVFHVLLFLACVCYLFIAYCIAFLRILISILMFVLLLHVLLSLLLIYPFLCCLCYSGCLVSSIYKTSKMIFD